MSGKIYLRVDDGLVEMTETRYALEEVLQLLLAEYPDLLAGDQMRPADPLRWLLVAREAGIPDALGARDHFAIDHVFVDQDGIPTFVEVKRSTSLDLRRKVVGQMLDYAANATAHWPIDRVRSMFEDRCREEGKHPAEEIGRLTHSGDRPHDPVSPHIDQFSPAGPEDSPTEADRFWASVSDNLLNRRMRLVFVADVIPPELQRIVEYLNESMTTTEVLAVEVKQFSSQDGRTITLVPRVIGQTAAADDVKRSSRTSRTYDWDDASFPAEVAAAGGPVASDLARELVRWMRDRGLNPTFGRGRTGPMYVHVAIPGGGSMQPFDFAANGRVEVLFNNLSKTPPFDDAAGRHALKARLNAIPGVSITDATAEEANWTSFSVDRVADATPRSMFFGALEWVADAVREGSSGSALR